MGRLSTHVLDTVTGKPAAGMKIEFSILEKGKWTRLKTVQTNADGRTDEPVMAGDAMRTGEFKLVFHVAEYVRGGRVLPVPALPRLVPIRFGIADAARHYLVPLSVRPGATAPTVADGRPSLGRIGA
jgi:5-hydroxyisourate hydrolase